MSLGDSRSSRIDKIKNHSTAPSGPVFELAIASLSSERLKKQNNEKQTNPETERD